MPNPVPHVWVIERLSIEKGLWIPLEFFCTKKEAQDHYKIRQKLRPENKYRLAKYAREGK